MFVLKRAHIGGDKGWDSLICHAEIGAKSRRKVGFDCKLGQKTRRKVGLDLSNANTHLFSLGFATLADSILLFDNLHKSTWNFLKNRDHWPLFWCSKIDVWLFCAFCLHICLTTGICYLICLADTPYTFANPNIPKVFIFGKRDNSDFWNHLTTSI